MAHSHSHTAMRWAETLDEADKRIQNLQAQIEAKELSFQRLAARDVPHLQHPRGTSPYKSELGCAAVAATQHLSPHSKSLQQQHRQQQHVLHTSSPVQSSSPGPQGHVLSTTSVNTQPAEHVVKECVSQAGNWGHRHPPGSPHLPHRQPPVKAAVCVQQLAQALEKLQAKNSALKSANSQLARQLKDSKAEHAAAEAAVVARDMVLASRQEEVAQLKADASSAAARAQVAEQRSAQLESELARLRADMSYSTHASTQFAAELDAARRVLHSDRTQPSAPTHPLSSVASPPLPHAPLRPDAPFTSSSLHKHPTPRPSHLSPQSLSDLRSHLKTLGAEVEALQAENRQLRGTCGAAGMRTTASGAAKNAWLEGLGGQGGATQLTGGGMHFAGNSVHGSRHKAGHMSAPDELARLLQDPAGRSRLRAALLAADAADDAEAAHPLADALPGRGQLGRGQAAWSPGAAAAAGATGNGGSSTFDLGASVSPHFGAGGAAGGGKEGEPARAGRGGCELGGKGAGMGSASVEKGAGMGSASADKVRKREGHRKARLPAAPSSAPAPCKRRAATKPAAGGKVGAASSSVGKLRTQSDAQAATARSSSSAAAEPILFSTGSGPEVYTGPGAKLSADAAAEAAAAAALLEQLRADNAALNYQLQAAVSQLEAVGREQRTQVEAVGSAVHPALGRKQRTQLEMMKNSLAQAALDREQRTQLEVVRNSVAYAGVGREQHMPLEAMSREQHMQQLGMERPRAAMQEEAGAQTEISAMNAPFDQRHIHGQRATAAHKGCVPAQPAAQQQHAASASPSPENHGGTHSSSPKPHPSYLPPSHRDDSTLKAQAASSSPSPTRQAGCGVLFRSTDSGAGSKQPTALNSPDFHTKGTPSVRSVKSVLEDSHRPRSSSDVALLLESYSRARKVIKDQEASRAEMARYDAEAHDDKLPQGKHADIEAELAAKVSELARHKADLEHASMLIEDARAAQAYLTAQLDAAMGELQSVRHVLVAPGNQPEQAQGAGSEACIGLAATAPAAAALPQLTLGQRSLGRSSDQSGVSSLASLAHFQSPCRPEGARPCPSTISSHLQPTQAATGGSAQLLRAPGEGPCTSQPDPDPSIGLCAQLMRGPSEAPPTSQPGTDPSIGFCAQLMRGLSEAPPTSQPGTDPSSDGSQGDEEVEEVEEVGSQSLPGIYMPSPILEQMMVLPLVLFGGRVLEQGLGVVCEEPAPPSAWPELREIEIGSLDRGTAHDEAQIYMPAGQGLPGGSMEVDHEIGICGEDLDHSSRGSQLTGMVESVAHWGGSSREALLLSLEGLHRHSQQSREAGSDAVGSALDAQHAAMQAASDVQQPGSNSDARRVQLALLAEVEALEQRNGEAARLARKREQGLRGHIGEKSHAAAPVSAPSSGHNLPPSRQQQHQPQMQMHAQTRSTSRQQQQERSQMLAGADAEDMASTKLFASAEEEGEVKEAAELGQPQLDLHDHRQGLQQGAGQVQRHPQQHRQEDQHQHMVLQPQQQQRALQHQDHQALHQQQALEEEWQQQRQHPTQQQQALHQLHQQALDKQHQALHQHHTQQQHQQSPPQPLGQRLAQHLKRHSLLSHGHPAAAAACATSTLAQPHSQGSYTGAALTHSQPCSQGSRASAALTHSQPHFQGSHASAASTHSQPHSQGSRTSAADLPASSLWGSAPTSARSASAKSVESASTKSMGGRSSAGSNGHGPILHVMEGSCTSGNSGAPPPAAPLASLSNAGATSRSVEPEEETEKAHGSRVCPGGGPGKAEEAVGKDQGAASVLLGTAIGPEHVAASQQQQQQQQLWTGLGGDGRCSVDEDPAIQNIMDSRESNTGFLGGRSRSVAPLHRSSSTDFQFHPQAISGIDLEGCQSSPGSSTSGSSCSSGRSRLLATAGGERLVSVWGGSACSLHSIQHVRGTGQLEGLFEGVSSGGGRSEGSAEGIMREGSDGGGSADGMREDGADRIMREGHADGAEGIMQEGSNGGDSADGMREDRVHYITREGGADGSMQGGSNGGDSKSCCSLYSVQNVRGGGPCVVGAGAGGADLPQACCNGKIKSRESSSSSSSSSSSTGNSKDRDAPMQDCHMVAHARDCAEPHVRDVIQGMGSNAGANISCSRSSSSKSGSGKSGSSSSSSSSESGNRSSSRSSSQPACSGLPPGRGSTGGGSLCLPAAPQQGEASVGLECSDLQIQAAPSRAEHGHCNGDGSVKVVIASQGRTSSNGSSSSSVCSGRGYGSSSCSSTSSGHRESLRASGPKIGSPGPVNMPGWEQQEDGVVRFVGLTPHTSSKHEHWLRPDVSMESSRPDLESLSARLQSMNEALSGLSVLHLR